MITKRYSKTDYLYDVEHIGLKKTWDAILDYVSNNGENGILTIDNFGRLYEMGLAEVNKELKKKTGTYYTPLDVSRLMAKFAVRNNFGVKNICDVCCGTGNLILAYLAEIGEKEAIKWLKGGHIYLYDIDEIALSICVKSIEMRYGAEASKKLKLHCGDFLNKSVHLPKYSLVLTNPPYGKFDEILPEWKKTKVLCSNNEYYSAFLGKILEETEKIISLTPMTFINGKKFSRLRYLIDTYRGFIYSFDNVPTSIFNGKKQGVFNSNTSNSVRAAILVTKFKMGSPSFGDMMTDNSSSSRNKPWYSGFIEGEIFTTPLIRFCASERQTLLDPDVLDRFVDKYHGQQSGEHGYMKGFKELWTVYNVWTTAGTLEKFGNLVSDVPTQYKLTVPTTCRYFTRATKYDLNRKGKMVLYFKTDEEYKYAYAMLNSSFAYMYWRMFDGGITYTKDLLFSMPTFSSLWKLSLAVSQDDIDAITKMYALVDEMMAKEKDYLVYKKNNGAYQENIRFPLDYVDALNKLLVKSIGLGINEIEFWRLHSHKALMVDLM